MSTTPFTDPHTTGSATTTPFSLSVLTVGTNKGHVQKEILADPTGMPVKGHRSLGVTRGTLAHIQVAGLDGLKALLMGIRHDQALVHGIVKDSHPGDVATVVTTEMLATAKPGALPPGTIARSLRYLAYPDDYFLLMFDRDDHPDDPTHVETVAELIPLLAPLLPDLETAGRLVTTSTSSGIKAHATHEWLIPPKGSHTYFLAHGDLARFKGILKARLWNAGYGYCTLASPHKHTGVASVLERAIVDLSVFSAERLDYVAGASIATDAPFYQDRGEPQLTDGSIFALDALPDLTPAEQQEYQERLTDAKAALAPTRKARVKSFIEAEDPTLSPAQVEAIITQRLAQHESTLLGPDYLLYFFRRHSAVPVSKLSAAHDGLRLADPHEPEYRDGSDAIFHWRKGDWRIVSWAHGEQRTYKAVPLPPPPPDDVSDLEDLLHHAPDEHQRRDSRPRPLIRLTTDAPSLVDDAIAALMKLPMAPLLYQRARRVCHIASAGEPPKWLRRHADIPIIHEIPSPRLWELLTDAGNFEKFDGRKGAWKSCLPPHWIVDVIRERTPLPFPMLEGIVCSPTLRPDGTILDTEGYDPETGLYLTFNGVLFPPIPAHPTFDDARTALGDLWEVFQDFPFADLAPSSQAKDAPPRPSPTNPYFSAAIAAVLTIVGRHAIQGNVPLFGATATASGTGKGKLVDAIVIIGTGRLAPKMGQTMDENEELKRLLALALEGATVCCIDNVVHPLGNQHLDMALTSHTIVGRILGLNKTEEAPWHAVMFATGNNLGYRGDMARRVVPIALDPKMEKPEERTAFAHPNLEAWVLEERPRLVSAALTILRAYCAAGRPAQPITPYGSFEAWSDLIRSAVVWLGEPDPCEGRQNLAAQTDDAYENLAALLEAWNACYPPFTRSNKPQQRTLQQIKQDIALHAAQKEALTNPFDQLDEALMRYDDRPHGKTWDTGRVGNALRKIEGRVVASRCLKRGGMYQGRALWGLESLAPSTQRIPPHEHGEDATQTPHRYRDGTTGVHI